VTWVRIDDHFASHPKVLMAGPLAGWLHVAALCYCAQHLTDGFVALSAVRTLADFKEVGVSRQANLFEISGSVDALELADRLVDTGLWEAVQRRGRRIGFRIHDYLEYNPSKREVEAERAAARQRMGRVRGKFGRTSGELREKFGDPVPRPHPRVPRLLKQTSAEGGGRP
jgi:hypothetical protein